MPAGPSVERIAHAEASPEGENSTYVLPEVGLVIDPGPPGEAAWETLTAGLSTAGLPVESVDTVAVTHWHADHAGLAPRLAEAAGAELVLHEADAPLVGDYADARSRRVDQDARRLREWGVPEATIDEVFEWDTPSAMPDQYPVTSVTDGETVAGTTVLHTPGHTAGHIALDASDVLDAGDARGGGKALDAGDALFVGDAVLPTYTPNVGGSDTRVESPLSTFLDTLDRLRDRAADGTFPGVRAFPGHGSTVDLPTRIETIRAHHAERVRDAVATLPGPDETASSDPAGRTPWDVATELFGEMRGIHAKMGAGEAAAHLSFAADRGLAERVGGDPDRYVRTDADLGDPLSTAP